MEAAGPPDRRVQLLRSKSLPAPELERRLPLTRHDSNLSAQSGAKDSGFASGTSAELHGCDGDSSRVNGKPKASSSAPGTAKKTGADGHNKTATIRQHYYPEGGWGWVIVTCACFVQVVVHGLHTAFGVLYIEILRKFGWDKYLETAWLGALSTSLSLLLTPVVVALCRRKSTRLTAVLGGLVTALGCLFTSFASQFHQLFFSYGIMTGVGVGLVRDPSDLMVGQYFKRKRETVEVLVVGASGFGIAITSSLLREAIRSVGWRLGLQAVTGVVFVSFFLGVFYRSATLYHPQRRAILHLKNQKRKIKEKAKTEEKPPFFDFATLRSRTVQIVLFAAALAALGVNTPIVFLVYEAEHEGLSPGSVLLLQVFLGAAFALGCTLFGLLVVRNSSECRIARQYLCQASAFMVAVASIAFTAVHGYHGYVLFAWIYGIFCGGYHYALKMYAYEKVRARNFARAWGFVQWAQAIPTAFGIPITGYMNSSSLGSRSGFFFSSACVLASSIALFLVDVHKRRVQKQRSVAGHSTHSRRRCSSGSCTRGRLHAATSLPDLEEAAAGHGPPFSVLQQRGLSLSTYADLKRAELTCISEEGIADLADNLFDDYDQFLADCMTSCDQVEHYLMLSEYENNLIKTHELESFLDRNRRRKSLGRVQAAGAQIPEDIGAASASHCSCGIEPGESAVGSSLENPAAPTSSTRRSSKDASSSFRTNAWRLLQNPSRSITVIDEITTAL